MARGVRERWIAVARGDAPPDLVLRGGRVLSVFTGECFRADVAIADDRIVGVGDYDGPRVYDVAGKILVPGLIDGHCHIESSKLDVPEFAAAVLRHGTTGVVVDPHELANVLGVSGVEYVLQASERLPLRVFVTLPSCVPASPFESPARAIEAPDYEHLMHHPRVIGIAEMMNYPAAVAGDPGMMAKMALTGYRHVDGHAPGLSAKALNAYLVSGPSSDHECTTLGEALEKERLGMWIMIREATMIRNLADLLPLVQSYGTDNCMFVTDDREAGTLLVEGHMNAMVRKAVALGLSAGNAVKLASLQVARYHELHGLGAVAPGYCADIAVMPDLESFVPSAVFSGGQLVVAEGEVLPFSIPEHRSTVTGTVRFRPVTGESFRLPAGTGVTVRVVELVPDQVVTRAAGASCTVRDGEIVADTSSDLVKVAVIERHHATGRIGLGLVRGFGLQRGAFASTVCHDAHNLIVAGISDDDMAVAATRLQELGGGLAVVMDGRVVGELPLAVAGLMSSRSAKYVAGALDELHVLLAGMGVAIPTPFMYLGFLGLSVIPELRITDRGLVDVRTFELVPLTIP